MSSQIILSLFLLSPLLSLPPLSSPLSSPLSPLFSLLSSLFFNSDLIKQSTKHEACPYYMSRHIHEHAEIVFMPYNYLLDPSVRESLKVSLRNSVIIIDEAHNVESVCCEVPFIILLLLLFSNKTPKIKSFLTKNFFLENLTLFLFQKALSFEITSTQIALCIRECDKIVSLVQKPDYLDSLTLDSVLIVKEKILNFEQVVTRIHQRKESSSSLSSSLPPVDPSLRLSFFFFFILFLFIQLFCLLFKGGIVQKGEYIYTLFEEAGFSVDTYDSILEILNHVC